MLNFTLDNTDLPDDDPDVIAGMERLARLRQAEADSLELFPNSHQS